MKNNVMPSRVQMEADVLKNLLSEVKETVATDFVMAKPAKSFKAIDLWRIQRNQKLATGLFRRRSL
jgi:hypothetical protein